MVRISAVEEKEIAFDNGIVLRMPCKGEIWSYLELLDRVIVVLFVFDTKRCNQFRNIFCYAKEDGHLIWQVEQPYGRDHQPLEAVYKYIALHIRGEDGGWLSIAENGSIEVDHELDDGSEVGGQIYLKPFRYGVDRLSAMTLHEFPSEYWIDYETGKVEWFAIHQKV
jgi:hypothetical protein